MGNYRDPDLSLEEMLDEMFEIKRGRRPRKGVSKPGRSTESYQPIPRGIAFMVPREFCAVPKTHKVDILMAFKSRDIDPQSLYDCVMDFYREFYLPPGVENPLVRYKFPDIEKAKLLNYLIDHGFDVTSNDFQLVIAACKETEKAVLKEGTLDGRPMVLNNFDYDYLIHELEDMNKDFPGALQKYCPTLCRLVKETEQTKSNEYPGRHLKFKNIKGIRITSVHRFKILHLMDEILYTSNFSIDDDEMVREIIKRVDFYLRRNDMRKRLSRYWVILSELISCSLSKQRSSYRLDAYEQRDGVVGHKYAVKMLPRSNRAEKVLAFKMMISRHEAIAIEKELTDLRHVLFNRKSASFADRFPMLSVFANLKRLTAGGNSNPSASGAKLKQVNDTDMETIDFGPMG